MDMSSKDIYEADRYAANRYAAGRWRGVGVTVTTTVNDGWTAQSRSRVLIAESRNRVWIAKGKSQ